MSVFGSIRTYLERLLGKADSGRRWQEIAEEGLELGGEDFPEDRGELHER